MNQVVWLKMAICFGGILRYSLHFVLNLCVNMYCCVGVNK